MRAQLQHLLQGGLDSFTRDFSAIGMPSMRRTSSSSTNLEAEYLGMDADDLRTVDPEVTSVAIQELRSYTLYRAKLPSASPWDEASSHTQRVVIAEALAASARHAGHQQKQHLRFMKTQSESTEVVGFQRWCVRG